MRLKAQLARVQQAEHTAQSSRQHSAARYQQFAQHWRANWTPGRILGAGLLGGFVAGYAQPHALARGGDLLKLAGIASNLLATFGAQVMQTDPETPPPAADTLPE